MNHLLESVYHKFKVNLQIYSVNFCFLMYWRQRWDLRGISDDIWRKGETAVVPTHPLSSLSFLPSVEVVTKLPGFELHPLCVCAPYLIGFPFWADWVGWQVILPEAKPRACWIKFPVHGNISWLLPVYFRVVNPSP